MKIIDKKKVMIFLAGISFCSVIHAQTTIILQPDGSQGKDAYLDSRLNFQNFGDYIDFAAISWTNQGTPVDIRSLIDFDLSSIPNGSTINSASLSLYSYDSPANGAHSTLSGSNESVIQRVTNSWDENTVTWNNQPSVTTQNQVFLSASTSTIQDYLNIDVTNLVQDMIDNPNNSHGFRLKLVTEEYYRRMVFASSDWTDASLHPKLEVTFTENIQNDTCFTLRPNAEQGKDAYLDSRLNNQNFGDYIDFASISWTNQGTPVDIRSLIDFDLSNIPNGATISSADLSLYSYDSPANGAHSPLSGSNASVINRVTTPWDENTVTWNNQPAVATQNQVFLPASTNTIQDYLSIDVTNLVQDMIDNPNNSHGFRLKLVTEEYYRRLVFASSDWTDSTLHPKLEICYAYTLSIAEEENNNREFNIFPNPTSDMITIDLSNFNQEVVSIDVINSVGQTIKRLTDVQSSVVVDVSDYSKGLYFVKVYFDNFNLTKKLIIH